MVLLFTPKINIKKINQNVQNHLLILWPPLDQTNLYDLGYESKPEKEIFNYRINFSLKRFIHTPGLISGATLQQKHLSHSSVAIFCLATETVSKKSRMQPKVTVIKQAIQVSGRLFCFVFFF